MRHEVLALIPARIGSKGIPLKNWIPLCGSTPTLRAITVARQAGVPCIVLSTDARDKLALAVGNIVYVERPSALAQDQTPMIDVVMHALHEVPGPDDQMVLLVQPTQPLRQAKHLEAAIRLLEETQADSVVSVVELPRTHHPLFVLRIGRDGCLDTYDKRIRLAHLPQRQAVVAPPYIRDGTVYAFWRRTVTRHRNIYGEDVRPLIIPPEETCPLDTVADWMAAERLLFSLLRSKDSVGIT